MRRDARDIASGLISPNVFLKSFFRSQLPHKSVDLSFTITDAQNKNGFEWELTLQNDFKDIWCEIRCLKREKDHETLAVVLEYLTYQKMQPPRTLQ